MFATASLILAATLGAGPEIPAIREAMERMVKDHEISGAVTLVASREGIVHLDAVGLADIAANRPMRDDTIFWIASMTKPVTATAVAMLQEEGKLSADDPVEKYLPEFAALKTADGKPARVTIRQILTHTSGMADLSFAEARGAKTLADLIPRFVAKPLNFEPGSKWAYCQSGINTAGRIVEVVSGRPFEVFLEERLFGPLGMKDTTFYLTPSQVTRLAVPYKRTASGTLEASNPAVARGENPTSRNRFPAANGGLYSTAPDYARFARMILRGGELDGRRYLKPESVASMTELKTGDLKTGFTDGCGWALGWCVVRSPQGVSAGLSPGSFGHGGAHGTQAWIDPKADRATILLIQRSDFPNSDASVVRRAFADAASPKR